MNDFYKSVEERNALVNELREKGFVDNREIIIRRSDTTEIWVSISAVLYPNEGYIEAVMKDINETKQNLLELQKVNYELDNFVYHASHDLRSPLRSLLGLISILRKEVTGMRPALQCIEMMEGSIGRLDNLVVDLLSLSRNNRVNDPQQKINLLIELNNTITNFYHAAKTENLEILVLVRQPVQFYGDLTRVRIILNNLMSNALKYRSYDKEHSYIKVLIYVDKNEMRLVVEDNGEGIPKEKVNQVFDMFVRASESSEGSGLGLYIVKNVIDKMKGKVELESEEKVGTTFRITIPNGKRQDD
ncbi:MAG: PAS domain-containing sensor histidine kinase [Cytophagales bacterium]|nr:PAS domain-containing sensor histidine kinase [Cytophagales bacterium]